MTRKVFFVLVCFVLLSSPVSATVVFSEGFDDGELADPWESGPRGIWIEEEGSLRYQESVGAKGRLLWRGMSLNSSLIIEYSALQRGGHNPSADVFLKDSEGVYARISPRRIEGYTLINSTGHRTEAGEVGRNWVNLRIVVNDSENQISLYDGGNFIQSIQETEPVRNLSIGLFGNSGRWSRFSDYTIAFDNISVRTVANSQSEGDAVSNDSLMRKSLVGFELGNFDNDRFIERPVGSLPKNDTLSTRLRNHSKRDSEKNAFVASEYRYDSWPLVLGGIGGGMWAGKSVGHELERQGYDVARAVEHRAEPEAFLRDLTPARLGLRMREATLIRNGLAPVLGQGAATAAAQAYVTVSGARYAERALEQYLEFDWDTAGFDPDRAERRLSNATLADVRDIGAWMAYAAATDPAAIGTAMREQGVQALAASAAYGFLWPDRYPELTEQRLRNQLRDADVVYYNGAGNRSAWILPNTPDSLTGHGAVATDRYNGSRAVRPWELPELEARIIFDDSDGATAAGNDTMWRAAVRQGAAAYIGTAGANHEPYASEVATRFFRQGRTVGEALQKAINGLRRDRLPGIPPDPFREEVLSSYRLIGDPSMPKDPVRPRPHGTATTRCADGTCTRTFTVTPDHAIAERNGTRVLRTDAHRHLMFTARPIVPLFGDRVTLPADTAIHDTEIAARSRVVDDVAVPRVTPPTANTTWNRSVFPPVPAAVNTTTTLRNRTELSLRHAAFQAFRNGSVRLFENVTVTVTYETPITIRSLDAANRTVTVRSWSRAPANATATVTAGNRTAERAREHDLQLPGGNATHHLPLPAGGPWRHADITLTTGNATVGPRTAWLPRPSSSPEPAFQQTDPVKLLQRIGGDGTGTAPATGCTGPDRDDVLENLPCLKGERFDVSGVTMNIGNIALIGSIIASLVTIPAASFGMTGDIAAAATTVAGPGTGNASAPVNVTTTTAPDGIVKRMATPHGDATFRLSGDRFTMRLSSPQRTVAATHSPRGRTASYRGADAALTRNRSVAAVVERCETVDGVLTVHRSQGTTERSFSGVDRDAVASACEAARSRLQEGLDRLARTAADLDMVAEQVDIVDVDVETETVTLRNTGPVGISLDGWTVQDEAGNTYTFDALPLSRGDTVTIHSDDAAADCETTNGPAFDRCWSDTSIWNDDGDTVTVQDASGDTVARRQAP